MSEIPVPKKKHRVTKMAAIIFASMVAGAFIQTYGLPVVLKYVLPFIL